MDDAEVVALYRSGVTGQDLADRAGCGTSRIYRVLRRNGISAHQARVRERHYDSPVVGLEADIAARYVAGETMEAIASSYGVHRVTIANALGRAGINPRRRGPATPEATVESHGDRIAALRRQRWSINDIGLELGVSSAKISRLLQEMGMPGRVGVRDRKAEVQDAAGYRAVWVERDDPVVGSMARGNDPRGGYAALHRVAMARSLGRPLGPLETVHHVNGDRADNRLENLQLRHGPHGKGAVHRCRTCGSHDIETIELH